MFIPCGDRSIQRGQPVNGFTGPTAVARTIEFENTEVTDADVALSSNKEYCNGQLTFLEGHRSLYYWIILAQVFD
jgi:hypothetical protein